MDTMEELERLFRAIERKNESVDELISAVRSGQPEGLTLYEREILNILRRNDDEFAKIVYTYALAMEEVQ
ncbi:hypothetical protein [Candidatus Allofournierella merdipullorum]|uniref:hypothetical protein n=1 Tax=Candidatus Allofournierella merdipullorum TaxID=2838595 RepID=UPI00374EF2C8